ncbi:MAG TPA: hypothetical protein VMS43_16190 [Allosphingosinicella sp.]|nr:hypothetical protein [Allosphingosinicella sp.]
MQQSTPILLEAIALRTCVRAVYNGGRVTLAPHILYQRHDELFIDAITIERDDRPPREVKLGTFKLSGLRNLALAGRPFAPEPSFDPGDPRYASATLFAVGPD